VEFLATGFVREWMRMEADRDVFRVDERQAPELAQALAQFRMFCLLTGYRPAPGQPADPGADALYMSYLATIPLREWGIQEFTGSFPYADLILVDGDCHVPTRDALAIAIGFSSMDDIEESTDHRHFREVLSNVKQPLRNTLYTDGRQLVVERSAILRRDLDTFCMERTAIALVMQSFFRAPPRNALFEDGYRVCAGCGSLLFPSPDTSAWPKGRCRIRECREEHGFAGIGRVIDPESDVRLLKDSLLSFWVGPGLGEIKIHRALTEAGLASVLYPECDAADVGVNGFEIGIDVKSYASPDSLARHFLSRRSIGGLAKFDRRIIAIPDAKVRAVTRYLQRLDDQLPKEWNVEVRSVSQTIMELTR